MANHKLVDGKDTLTRIQEHWEYIVANDLHPTVAEFARAVGITNSPFRNRYTEWAEKVRERRDKNRPTPRRLSPACLPNAKKEEMAEALDNLTALRKEYAKLQSRYRAALEEIDRLRPAADRVQVAEARSARILGLMDTLEDALEGAGLKEYQVNRVFEVMKRRIVVVKGSN